MIEKYKIKEGLRVKNIKDNLNYIIKSSKNGIIFNDGKQDWVHVQFEFNTNFLTIIPLKDLVLC